MSHCPCGSGLDLDTCCGPLINGASAKSPEALMRSRYTAFTLGNLDYIEGTCTEEALGTLNRADLERSLPETKWLEMKVRETSGGSVEDVEGTVTFSFRYTYGAGSTLRPSSPGSSVRPAGFTTAVRSIQKAGRSALPASAATIHVRAAPGRNTRSAAVPRHDRTTFRMHGMWCLLLRRASSHGVRGAGLGGHVPSRHIDHPGAARRA